MLGSNSRGESMTIANQLKQHIRRRYYSVKLRNRRRIFCIGRNKTGTTSIGAALRDLGFVLGDQREAERLYDRHYFAEEFEAIIDYCRSAEAFQDIPFSCPGTYRHLDRAFPRSKFILSVRDSADQWYSSLTRFHAKKYGGGKIPSYSDLEKATYLRRGFMTHIVQLHGTTPEDPYNKEVMTAHYDRHNADVRSYFSGRPEDFLVINLSEECAFARFKEFLGVASSQEEFPRKLPRVPGSQRTIASPLD